MACRRDRKKARLGTRVGAFAWQDDLSKLLYDGPVVVEHFVTDDLLEDEVRYSIHEYREMSEMKKKPKARPPRPSAAEISKLRAQVAAGENREKELYGRIDRANQRVEEAVINERAVRRAVVSIELLGAHITITSKDAKYDSPRLPRANTIDGEQHVAQGFQPSRPIAD